MLVAQLNDVVQVLKCFLLCVLSLAQLLNKVGFNALHLRHLVSHILDRLLPRLFLQRILPTDLLFHLTPRHRLKLLKLSLLQPYLMRLLPLLLYVHALFADPLVVPGLLPLHNHLLSSLHIETVKKYLDGLTWFWVRMIDWLRRFLSTAILLRAWLAKRLDSTSICLCYSKISFYSIVF